jgi:hypothetical protein
MLKFQAIEGCEALINDAGCLVIKQYDLTMGQTVMVILTPAMAWEIARMVDDYHEEMIFAWADGLIERHENPKNDEAKNGTHKNH